MARAHKGDRVPVSLRIPRALFNELEEDAVKFGVDRHAFILAMMIRGLKNWKAT
jgi:hypothetical protein